MELQTGIVNPLLRDPGNTGSNDADSPNWDDVTELGIAGGRPGGRAAASDPLHWTDLRWWPCFREHRTGSRLWRGWCCCCCGGSAEGTTGCCRGKKKVGDSALSLVGHVLPRMVPMHSPVEVVFVDFEVFSSYLVCGFALYA